MQKLIAYSLVLLIPFCGFSQLTETALFQLSRIPVSVQVIHSKNAVIKWRNHLGLKSGFFIVERRNESGEFAMIVSLRVTARSAQYEVTDQSPLQGVNYYRVKHVDEAGRSLCSLEISVDLGSGEFSRFYPNPADNCLIIQSQCAVDVKIFSNGGNLALSKLLDKGITAVDVSALTKGIYLMMITNTQTKNSLRQVLYKN